ARAPRRLVPAPEGVAGVADWAGASAGPAPAPLALPAADLGDDGIVHLGPDGAALVCVASSLNLALCTPAEQQALIGAYAGFLNSLSEPLQILLRAEPVDLAPTITALREAAGGLPHPALETAAREHAAFLGELADRGELLRRQILVVLRQPAAPGRRDGSGVGTWLRHRAKDAAAALAAAGITLTPIAGADAAGVLARAADPHNPTGETRTVGVGVVVSGARR
ncbi:MAG: PrgI family protein, partial [Acidimicrobiales bacterium]